VVGVKKCFMYAILIVDSGVHLYISSMLYVNGRNEKQPKFRWNEFWVFLYGRLQVFGSHSSLAINPS